MQQKRKGTRKAAGDKGGEGSGRGRTGAVATALCIVSYIQVTNCNGVTLTIVWEDSLKDYRIYRQPLFTMINFYLDDDNNCIKYTVGCKNLLV